MREPRRGARHIRCPTRRRAHRVGSAVELIRRAGIKDLEAAVRTRREGIGILCIPLRHRLGSDHCTPVRPEKGGGAAMRENRSQRFGIAV